MLIRQVSIHGEQHPQDILINEHSIQAIYPTGSRKIARDIRLSFALNDAIAFPGLINSHDHLDFNAFPQLGNAVYANYREWAKDIHSRNASEIRDTLKIPKYLRVLWGIYKNLLNGVTTVVNHGKKLQVPNDLVTVFQHCHCLHSTAFEKNWKWKLNKPFSGTRNFVMHTGEGTDQLSHAEIDKAIRWNLWKKGMVGVHGVSMDPGQAEAFKALVWCPASNYFLYGKTADLGILKEKVTVLFGTDSTLSAGWNLWDHLRLARDEKNVSDEELLDMLTISPAKIWHLKNNNGLTPGSRADLVVARKTNSNAAFFDNFFSLNPEDLLLVVHQGAIRLIDESLYSAAEKLSPQAFYKIRINQSTKYVQGNLPGLIEQMQQYDPGVSLSMLQPAMAPMQQCAFMN